MATPITPRIESLVAQPAALAPQPAVAPVATPRRQPLPPSLQPLRAPAPPPEPDIHVSIGRIEIRAVNAPAEPRRAASGSPVMTLDAYLRSRSAGRRA